MRMSHIYQPVMIKTLLKHGVSAGQTIFHCHIHLIPRRDGDVKDPRGGVRGVIPEKQKY